jgi:predicted flavoprotein YhiN
MTDTVEATAEEVTTSTTLGRLMGADHVVVCLGGLSVHTNGSPIFGCKVYGPFTKEEVAEKAAAIRVLEGGACFVRPLVDLADTYRRLSAD